jgi:hypothetical protein
VGAAVRTLHDHAFPVQTVTKLKVLQSVVELVSVYVMNCLFSAERPAKELGHNNPVL